MILGLYKEFSVMVETSFSIDRHHHHLYEVGLVTCFSSVLLSEIMNHFDNWWDSLDGGSALRKACTQTGQHSTERHRQAYVS
jgi:hypothetical protein